MSLEVNLEPGGAIWHARRRMAASSESIPLNAEATGFDGYAIDMARARMKSHGLDRDQAREYYEHLAAESMHSPIGRQLTKEKEFPGSKQLTINMTLLNESVGIMPEYVQHPTARKLGRLFPRMSYASTIRQSTQIFLQYHPHSTQLDVVLS